MEIPINTVVALEEKIYLSELIERIEQGEMITITKHGEPAALLSPVHESLQSPTMTHEDIVEGMRKLREQFKEEKVCVLNWIHKGH